MGSTFFNLLSNQEWRDLFQDGLNEKKSNRLLSHSEAKHDMRSPKDQKSLNERLKNLWIENIKGKTEHLSPENIKAFEKKFSWLLAEAKRRVLGSKLCPILTVQEVSKVMQNIESYNIVAGKGIKPFDFLKPDQKDQNALCSDAIVASVLRYCWGDPDVQISSLFSKSVSHHKEISTIDHMNKIACQTYNHVFEKLLHQLQTDKSIDPEIATVAVRNMLALVPYFAPADGTVFTVPVFHKGQWEASSYKTERVRVSAEDYPFSPYYAYGLIPVDLSKETPPMLLFMGTTYPASSGGFFTYLSDLNPFGSVGIWAFDQGFEAIKSFCEKAHAATGQKLEVVGQSLGGYMTLHTATQLNNHVKEAYAFSPAALYKKDLSKWEEAADLGQDLPSVHVYRQQFDNVPMFGNAWGKGWEINYVHGFKMKGSIEGHVRMGMAAEEVLLAKVKESVRPSFKRSLLCLIHVVAGGVLFLSALAFIEVTKLIVKGSRFASESFTKVKQCFASRRAAAFKMPVIFPHHATRLLT